MSAKILYVGRFGLPDTAPGIRVYNIIKILKNLGYDVDVISNMGVSRGGAETQEYDGIKYTYVNILKSRNKPVNTVSNIFELLFARKTLSKIKAACDKEKPRAIILYNDLYRLTKKLLPYCKQNNIKLIADVTEWYEKRKFKKPGDKIIPFYTNKRILKLDKQLDAVIAVSRYLYDYYTGLGVNTLFIPPLCEVPSEPPRGRTQNNGGGTLNLIYAGSPGKKDLLVPALEALQKLNVNRLAVRLDLLGLDEKDVYAIWRREDLPKAGVFAHGRVPHNEALKYVKNADFGILLREDKRYAKAGYSTKFSECMSYGAAMICNRVGGTDLDIDDGINGILLNCADFNELYTVLSKLIGRGELIIQFRQNAYDFAKRTYSPALYMESVLRLLEKNTVNTMGEERNGE